MNCQDALELLYDIIDKEASEIDAKEVQEHLVSCRDCFKIYQLETNVQEFIAERIRGDGPSPQLDSLKDKIILRLDNIDNEVSPGQPPRSFGLIAKMLVAAACLVILIGAASIATDYYREYVYYTPLASAHHAVHDRTWDQPTFELSPSYLGLDFSNLGLEQGFVLINSSKEQICGVEMGHFVFRNSELTVSVFAALSGEYSIPEDCIDTQLSLDGKTFFNHQSNDCWLLFHEVGNAVIIAASTKADFDLSPFAPVEKVVLTDLSLP
ncbi:MAG: zf-HC2 domain-containing protein [candidate division Zixibacteria bacterium]|nr:zf-HC2 domain-containing protein [candidate division Zixibacteria bacterium]